jgi:O-antigen/teichoic acid export membrane protein
MNSLVKSTMLYTVGNILPQAINFLMLPIITRYMSIEQFGIIGSMSVIQYMLSFLFSLSLESSIIRLYWDYDSESERKKFLGTIFSSISLNSLILLTLLFVFHNYIAKFFNQIEFFPYYVFTILATFFATFSYVPLSLYRLRSQPIKYFTLSLTQLILNTFFIIWFVVFQKKGAEGMLEGKMIASAILVPFFVLIAVKNFSFSVNWKMLKKGIYFSFPIIVTMIAAWVLSQADKMFIAKYFSLGEVGIYSLSRQIAAIISLVSGAFALAYNPLFFEIANSRIGDDNKLKLEKYNFVFTILLILFWFIISLFAKEAIQLFLNNRYYLAFKFVPILSFAFVISSTSSVLLGNNFQQSKKMKENMVISIIGAGLTIILFFFLIIPFGALGACLVAVISNTTIFTFSYYYTKSKCYFVCFNWKELTPLLTVLVVIVAFAQIFEFLPFMLLLVIKLLIVFALGIFILKRYKNQIMTLFKNPILKRYLSEL